MSRADEIIQLVESKGGHFTIRLEVYFQPDDPDLPEAIERHKRDIVHALIEGLPDGRVLAMDVAQHIARRMWRPPTSVPGVRRSA